MEKFMRHGEAVKASGLSGQTLRAYADKGIIESKRSPGNHRLYNIKQYLNDLNDKNVKIIENNDENKGIFICYCRVSSYDQKDDLTRQIEYMKSKYPNHEIISDIGSGINFKRKGLEKIIDYGVKGNLKELVVSYKDRLCRIGYDLIENILIKYSNTKIIIDMDKHEDINEEISNDIIEIITVYSSKVHGMRSYKKDI
jgi:predicted site-specific integrase-resolvase